MYCDDSVCSTTHTHTNIRRGRERKKEPECKAPNVCTFIQPRVHIHRKREVSTTKYRIRTLSLSLSLSLDTELLPPASCRHVGAAQAFHWPFVCSLSPVILHWFRTFCVVYLLGVAPSSFASVHSSVTTSLTSFFFFAHATSSAPRGVVAGVASSSFRSRP